jgi:hypothetical protein
MDPTLGAFGILSFIGGLGFLDLLSFMETWSLWLFVTGFSQNSLCSKSKFSCLGSRIAQWTFALWTFVELFGGRCKFGLDSTIRGFAGLPLVRVCTLAFDFFANWPEFEKGRHSKSLD